MGVLTRVLLVVNPAARRAPGRTAVARAAFAAAGVACDDVRTGRPGEGGHIARERHAAYDAVFTLGGDGTAMEVVGALRGTGRPVGILPGGTGNLLARTLGVPLGMRRAVPALLAGRVATVDLGVLPDGRCFAFAAGVGVDARMIESASATLKRRFGVGAYVAAAARAALSREEFLVDVEVDGERITRRAAAVLVANFGGVLDDLLRLGPGIECDDGRLDLCVFSPRSRVEAVRVIWRLFRKDFRDCPAMLYRRGSRFLVRTEPARMMQADGELLGLTPMEISTAPRAAALLVPAAWRAA